MYKSRARVKCLQNYKNIEDNIAEDLVDKYSLRL